MPKFDGYEATSQIRQQEQEKGLSRKPIIALTAHACKGIGDKCLVVGMDDYLSKPVKTVALKENLEKWLC